MVKKLLLLLLLTTFTYTAKAQYVTIPDANFAAKLQLLFPSCMVGNQMDTTCSAITSATSLNVGSLAIADLTGVQYFDSLSTLFCNNNLLITLPSLPPNLSALFCYNNLLTGLPSFPPMLHVLDCDQNQLTILPAIPNSIISLSCSHNYLTSLPTLQNHLMQLIAFGSNHFTTFPVIPDSVQQLVCGNNFLTSLPPTLPYAMWQMNCASNSLDSLPFLPNTLTQLFCNNCQLTSLPALPQALWNLQCPNNQLTSLPVLPDSLQALNCQNNFITCFPELPLTLSISGYINISGNPFTCLPNYVAGMDAATLAYPLCMIGNLYGCASSRGIVGYTYKDSNANCLYNSGDSAIINVHEKLFDNSGLLIAHTFSALNGIYDFPVDTGIYTVKVDTAGMPFTIQCVYPGIDSTVTLTTATPLVQKVDFSFECKPGFDIGVQSVAHSGVVRPGQQHTLYFVAGDISNWYNLHCASGVSGQVVVTVTGPVTYTGITAGALTPSVAGNVFTYTIVDFGLIYSSTAFGIVLTTDTTAVGGNSICVNITVTPTTGDNNPSNNTYNYCYNVQNSYDPNYKETYPENVPVGYIDYLTYTIHFQNTGSAPAINIHLQDTLDANLDLNTFQVINYSHYNTTWLNGNKLSFNFPNINLPDSTSDFDGSQGFVQYRIKPLAGLPGGTQIHNTASIYFDYNAPVVTNTSVNTFGTTNINQLTIDNEQLTISPNPTSGIFQIINKQYSIINIKITNLLGQTVYQSAIHNPQSTMSLDISTAPKGLYILEVTTASGTFRKRIIKE